MKENARLVCLFLGPILVWQIYLFMSVYLGDHRILSTLDLIKKYGYPGEKHKVMTEDGYTLSIFRIPYGKESPLNPNYKKPVILLLHGVLASSRIFVTLGPQKSLGFQLADRGYDVWLGNLRGGVYGSEHATYNTSDDLFWDFNCHDHGEYDLVSMVNYIIGVTNNTQLYFLGHSLGAALPLGLIAVKPEYNKKFAHILAVAPGVIVNEMRSPQLEFAATVLGPWQLKNGNGPFLNGVITFLRNLSPYCIPQLFTGVFCNYVYQLGGPSTNMNKEDMPSFASSSFTPTSRQLIAHIGQLMTEGAFIRWTPSEPDKTYVYPLHLVTAPVSLFYSDNDYVINPKNINIVRELLPNVTSVYKIPKDYNHVDFFFAESAPDLFYKEVFRVLESSH